MIRLFLVDSETRLSRWKEELAGNTEIELAGEASSIREFLSLAERGRPHVVLLGLPTSEEEAQSILETLKPLQFAPGLIVAAREGDPDAIRSVIRRGNDPQAVVRVRENDPESIRSVIRLQAKDFLPSDCQPGDLAASVARVYSIVNRDNRDRTGILLALWGCRGGAGTTSLALSLAGTARRSGLRAAVVDGDIALGDSAFLMNTRPSLTWVDWAKDKSGGENDIRRYLVMTEEGFPILSAPKSPTQSELVKPEAVGEALDLLVKSNDLVIVDLHRVFDEVTLHVAEKAQRLWLVTDPSLSGVKNISLLWNLLDQLRLAHEERASVINRVNKGNAQTAAKLASMYRAVAIVPEEPNLNRAWDSGQTPVRTMPRSPFVKGVETLLGHLFPEPSGKKGREVR